MNYQGNDIRLGQIIGTNQELVMSAEDRQTHLYLPGNTGVGKSKMMESMICQDIDQWTDSGCGLMLLDRHGSVYRNVLKYVVESRLDRPIIPLDFSRDDWILGYNPLRNREGADPSVITRALVAGMAHVFGKHDTQGTPRFGRVATTVLMTILQEGRPFLEAAQLASSKSAMAMLASSAREAFSKADLLRSAAMSDRDFYTEVESTVNRLRPFSQNQRFKAMFGHVGETLDLRKVLDEGAILLVNLEQKQNRLSEEDASLFGTLLLTDLWTAANDRGCPDDASEIRPFYVYVDEAQNFVTPTIAKNLTEARGFGLNVILASQYPEQFAEAGANGKAMYNATMAAARSKAVFQMSHLDDLESLTKQLFFGVLDPMKVKRFTKKVIGYEVGILRSRTRGTNRQEGESDGTHRGRGVGKSQRQRRGDETGDPDIYLSEQSLDGIGTTRSSVRGESESETEAEALMPVMGDEVAEYVSLDEQLAMFQQILNGQDKRECMVRLVSMKAPAALRTLDVPPPWVSDEDVQAYLQERFRSLPFALRLAEAIDKATQRERDFLQSIADLTRIDEPTGGRRVRRAKQIEAKVSNPPESSK
jgi:hypothetical protein